jgi:hypothetical protein
MGRHFRLPGGRRQLLLLAGGQARAARRAVRGEDAHGRSQKGGRERALGPSIGMRQWLRANVFQAA